jgi:hypothetical protein
MKIKILLIGIIFAVIAFLGLMVYNVYVSTGAHALALTFLLPIVILIFVIIVALIAWEVISTRSGSPRA